MFRALKTFGIGSRIAVILFAMSVAIFGMVPVEASATQFVTNGNFTSTDLSSPGGYICKQGTTCTSNVTDWSSTCNSNSCGNGATAASLLFPNTNGSAFNNGNALYGATNAPGGGNTIAIDGDPVYGASISQTISGLNVGTTYTLTFNQAAGQQRGLSGATTEKWAVTFGNDLQNSTVMYNPSQGFVGWYAQAMTFKATSASEVLSFLAIGTPGGEPPVALLSNVAINGAVPEPATWAMMLVGLGLSGVAMRRRAQSRLLAA